MQRVKTKILNADRGVGITAASSLIEKKLLRNALPQFEDWGIPTRVDQDIYAQLRSLAGADQRRAAAFLRLVKDQKIGAIWCARGGYGAARILHLFDQAGMPKLLRRTPKLLLGYSDVTALHFYFNAIGLPTIHCPMPATPSWTKMTPGVRDRLRALVGGWAEIGKAGYTAGWKLKPIYRGYTEGVLVGGNLSLLASLCGTPWQPDLRGKILMLEDVGERPYRVDRMLTQIHSCGIFKGLRGVVLGDFETDVEYKLPIEKKYWRDIFAERFQGIPLYTGLPVGHGKRNEPLPLGVRAAIDGGKLILLEQPVKRQA